MASSDIKLKYTWKELFAEAERLSNADFEKFASEILTKLARRKQSGPPDREAELLQKINTGLPQKTQSRISELMAKNKTETITKTEQDELDGLIEMTENLTTERVGHLGELAQIRNVSVRELLEQLEIKPAFDA